MDLGKKSKWEISVERVATPMIGTLWAVALAAAVFFGLHLVPGVPGLRAHGAG